VSQHISAPVPRLPEELAEHQCLVDGMLAKRPEERFESAEALLVAIDEVWTRQAMKKEIYLQ